MGLFKHLINVLVIINVYNVEFLALIFKYENLFFGFLNQNKNSTCFVDNKIIKYYKQRMIRKTYLSIKPSLI